MKRSPPPGIVLAVLIMGLAVGTLAFLQPSVFASSGGTAVSHWPLALDEQPPLPPAGAALVPRQRPEIQRITALPGPDLDRRQFVLVVSKGLTASHQARLMAALRLIPSDDRRYSAIDALNQPVYPFRFTLGDGPATRGATLLGSSLSYVWNRAGTEARVAIPTKTSRAPGYMVTLVAGDAPIQDREGQPLGTGPDGHLAHPPAAGEPILSAFAPPDRNVARLDFTRDFTDPLVPRRP